MLRKTKVATSINEAPSAITKKIEFSSARVSNDTRRKRLIGLFVCIVFGLIVGSLMSVEFIDVVFSSDSSENLLQGSTFDQHTEIEYNITLPSNDKLGDRENTYHSQEDNEKNENHLVATMPNLPLKGLRHKLESIIGPEYMTNEKDGDAMKHPFAECSPTSQFQIRMGSSSDKWILQTFDEYGNKKTVGGDEFYITFTITNDKSIISMKDENHTLPPPSLVAFIHDQDDGTYILNFTTTPMNPLKESSRNDMMIGNFTIYYEYTCGMGFLNQPEKKTWKGSGTVKEILFEENLPIPPFRLFQKSNHNIDFGKYDKLIAFGDSTMIMLVADKVINARKFEFKRKNILLGQNTRTWFSFDKIESIKTMFRQWHKTLPLNSAILVGSSIWDVLANPVWDLEDHLKTCRELISWLREEYQGHDIYWKGTSSMHLHRVDCRNTYKDCMESTKYMSSARTKILHVAQKRLMKEMNVTYIDLYDGYYLSAYYTSPGDGRHFETEVNSLLLDWYYPT